MNGSASQLDQFACLELRGGNGLATYPAQLPGLSVWVSCNPLRPSRRGGDLYYLSACSHGSIARVVIADVSGHGAMVSAAAIRFQNALRRYIDLWDQSLLVHDLNESIFRDCRGREFATAFLGSFASQSGDLLFTNAGHMLPLRYRAAAREWSYLHDLIPQPQKTSDLPLGLMEGIEYHQTTASLAPGDLVILYTDGISEAENEAGDQLGLQCLLAIARNLPVHSAMAAGEALVAAVARFRGNAAPTDDVTVVTLFRE